MSRKDDKRKIREEKKAAAERKNKRNALMVRIAIVILVPLTLFVFYEGLFSGPPALSPDVVGEADHVRGNTDADVTLTIYGDFQCPSCLSEYQLVARAWPQINQEVKLVYRHFPLDTHRFAFQAARYAEAAGRQGKFWEMHDLLFSNQEMWSVTDDPAPMFDSFAGALNLDMEQLKADMELPDVRAKIISDQQGGIRAGVRSTPSFFINGKAVQNPRTVSELIGMINEAGI